MIARVPLQRMRDGRARARPVRRVRDRAYAAVRAEDPVATKGTVPTKAWVRLVVPVLTKDPARTEESGLKVKLPVTRNAVWSGARAVAQRPVRAERPLGAEASLPESGRRPPPAPPGGSP